jgi:tetratricopeptide (TPR) repeat protein
LLSLSAYTALVAMGERIMTATATFLFRFTPSLMEREALEAIFVQREDTVNRIIERVRESAQTKSKYHTLFIGPRGIGKTHLVSLIYHRTKAMDDLEERLLIAWMREEEWGITSLLDLLMRIFRALVAEYKDDELEKQVEDLYKLPPENIEKTAGKLLKEYAGNRALLVLIENLDDIFQGLGDEGQKRLRAYIQENPFLTIVATSQSLFSGVSRQKSPFYGFFSIEHLTGLSFEESVQLLTNIARYKGDQVLAAFIQTPMGRARIRALNHLAGGNHRVYIIFSQFLTRESLDTLVEPFMQMLDDLTPYYQDRMRWLSTQQRKIVEFLLNHRSPAIVKDIAQRCFMSQQTASGQLKSLREMRYVQSIPAGRESYYELSEPLMRLCVEVKKNRGEPIRLFVDFLRLWYLPDELKQHLELLKPEAMLEREYVICALQAIAEDPQDPRVEACNKDLNTYIENGDFEHALEISEELVKIRGQAGDWIIQGACFLPVNRFEEALASFEEAIKMEPENLLAWMFHSSILKELKSYEAALTSLNKAIELAPDKADLWIGKGDLLKELGLLEDGLVSYNKAIELNPQNARALMSKIKILHSQGRFKDMLEPLDAIIKITPENSEVWVVQGSAFLQLELYEDAILSWDKAIELGHKTLLIQLIRAQMLLIFNRWDEGIAALDNALEYFAHTDEPETGVIGGIVENVFNGSPDASVWKARITTLLELYDKHKVAAALGSGLIAAVPALQAERVSDAVANAWREVWQELVGNRDEFKLPLRLLDVAIRYKESKDQRVLLELPIEERKVLEAILKIEEKTEN